MIKIINMYKTESVSNSQFYCRVGKITPKKNIAGDSSSGQLDFKTHDSKKSFILFTEKRKAL
jgi:hypothetical protein